jgi:hypothetical protein
MHAPPLQLAPPIKRRRRSFLARGRAAAPSLAVAVDAAMMSPSFRLHPEPMSAPSSCPRTSWSSHCCVLPCPVPIFTEASAPTATAAGLRRACSPAVLLPQTRTRIGRARPLAPSQPLPRPRPPARPPDFPWPRRPLGWGLHCRTGVLSRGVFANEGYICEPQTFSKGLFASCILSSYDFQLQLVKFIKNRRKSKNSKPNFFVLNVTRSTTFSKHVYTFELQFWLEK